MKREKVEEVKANKDRVRKESETKWGSGNQGKYWEIISEGVEK